MTMPNLYDGYDGKLRTDSNIAWHRPQSTSCRVDEELMHKSARALETATEPLDKLRLLCLSRGASGILGLGRIFRKMENDGSKHLNKEEFFHAIKGTGLELSDADVEALFNQFDTHNSGSIVIDEFMKEIRPPMDNNRRAIVEQAFRKLPRAEDGGPPHVKDLRGAYSVSANPRYKSGEETYDVIMKKFLHNFETEGTIDGRVTLEEFMNYYSAISVSIENDCNFDLMMRQAYKL